MRIATWNVNSLDRPTPPGRGVDPATPGPTSSASRRPSRPTPPSPMGRSPRSGTRRRTTATDDGTAWPSSAGSGIDGVSTGLGSSDDDQGNRLIAADCGGVRVLSVYVPNGRALDDEHYPAKLAWLARLRGLLDETSRPATARWPSAATSMWRPRTGTCGTRPQFEGMTHVSPPERAALADLEEWGLVDAFRQRVPGRQAVQLVGLPGRLVPPAPGHADRPDPGDRGRWPGTPPMR